MDKNRLLAKIESFQEKELEEIRSSSERTKLQLNDVSEKIEALQERLKELNNKKLQFPAYTMELKASRMPLKEPLAFK